MNLALEYLVRTKGIRNLFRTPSSLFIERGDDKIAITFDGIAGDHLRVKRWYITDCPVGCLLPHSLSITVPKEQIFDKNAIVPPGYFTMDYIEEAVDTSLNSYKRPMSQDMYSHFIQNMMCSEPHNFAKEQWLWDAFYTTSLPPAMKLKCPDKDSLLDDFASTQQKNHSWNKWQLWKQTFIPDRYNSVACELMFMS